MAGIGAWLDERREELARLHQVAARPRCSYGLDYGEGHALEIRAIPDARKFTRILEQHARRAAGGGDLDEAVRCVETLVRLGDHLPRPFAITYLVRLTLYGAAFELLEDVAALDGFDATAAHARLDGFLEAAEDPGAPVDAMRGERVLAILVARRWIAGESPLVMLADFAIVEGDDEAREVRDWLYGTWAFRPFAVRDGLQVLDDMERSIAAMRAGDWADLDRLDEEAEARTLPYLFSKLYAVVPAKVGRERSVHLALLAGRPDQRLLDPFTGRPLNVAGRRISAARPVPAIYRQEGWEDEREEHEVAWELPAEAADLEKGRR